MKRPLCLVCLVFVLAVFLYMEFCPLPVYSLGERAGRTIQLTGQVERKEVKNDKYVIYLKNVAFCNDDKSQQTKNTKQNKEVPEQLGVICYLTEALSGKEEPPMGAYVKIRGKMQEFSIATNPGEFDLATYYHISGYDFMARNTQIIGVTQQYDLRLECLYQLRQKLAGIYDAVLQEEDAAMMKAMVLGDKQDLEQESKSLFQKAGIAHILAISGLHISLLGMGLFGLLRKSRMAVIPAALLAVLVMIQFGDMTGMSSSASRAIFMFGCRLSSKVIRRSYDLLSAMVTSCMLLLIEQPLYIYHSGFLLSFGAIMGIGIMEPIWTDGIHRLKKNSIWYRRIGQQLWLALLGSLAIFAFQLPIMLSSFYELSPYSFFLNLFVIPLMSVVMLLGILVLLLGAIYIPLGIIPGMGIHLILALFTKSCKAVLQLPGGVWIVGKPEIWQFLLYGAVLLLIIGLHRWVPKWLLGMWFFTVASILTFRMHTGLEITMLDVGQGDGICMTSKTGHHYMIDCGSTSKKNLGQYQLIPFLKYQGIDSLDAVFLTHLDQDHISGIQELIEVQDEEHIYVKNIVLAQNIVKDEAYDKLISLCRQQNIPVRYMKQGDAFLDGELTITCLFPYAEYDTDDRNDASLILEVSQGAFSGLFTGDAGAEGEEEAVSYIEKWMPEKKYQIFKATHHGSKYSNTERLLERIRPPVTLLSCGKDNDYGHPHEEVLERLEQVQSRIFQTQECGAVTVEVKEDKMKIKQFLSH